jgi:hypothetical protein
MIALASSFLYYQMTTRWFQLMAMAGAEGAKEASGAMDDELGHDLKGNKNVIKICYDINT